MFEMIVLVVLISTVGKVLASRWQRVEPPRDAPGLGPGEINGIREAVDELNGRVIRLEEERDFYKALLDSPERQRELPSPGGEADPPSP